MENPQQFHSSGIIDLSLIFPKKSYNGSSSQMFEEEQIFETIPTFSNYLFTKYYYADHHLKVLLRA